MSAPGTASQDRGGGLGNRETILSVEGLTVLYNDSVLGVGDLSFEVGDGEILALVGPNGAGKTSTLRGIAGFLQRESATVRGRVRHRGRDIARHRPDRVARAGIALVPERDKVFTDLSVAEHFRLAHPARRGRSEAEEEALELFEPLRAHYRRSAGFLSGGERQMLAIATALIARPGILLIDEMSQGLAPALVLRLADAVERLHRTGLAMVIVEQNVPVAMELADRACVLEAGRMLGSGPVDDPALNAAIHRAFLGGEEAVGLVARD